MACSICVVFDCCNVCCVDVLLFFRTCFEVFYCHSCATSSIFMSQMAVGFWNAIKTDVSFGIFIINSRESSFSSFCPVQAVRSGFVWFTWLKCSNHFPLLLQCNHCLEMFLFFFFSLFFFLFLFFFFFLVSQALTTMLAKKGYRFRAWMYWVPLWWFVKSTLSCPTPFSLLLCD